ncbi:MAG: hypothetical protein RLZZ546_1901 [Bacteroidota bacterium]|jgi:hypothetical protein
MKLLKNIFLLTLVLFTFEVYAQKVSILNINSPEVIDPSIDAATAKELIKRIQIVVNDYQRCGRHADIGGDNINYDLAKCFSTLFRQGAIHYNDLVDKKNAGVIDATLYSEYIQDYFSGNNGSRIGLDFDIEATLNSIKVKEDGGHIINLTLIKTVKTQLDEKFKNLPYNPNGKQFKYIMTIYADQYDPDNATIESIKLFNGSGGSSVKSNYSYITIDGQYGVFGKLSSLTNSLVGFNNVQPIVRGYGASFSFNKAIKNNQKTFLSVGISLMSNTITSDMTGKFKSKVQSEIKQEVPGVQYYENSKLMINKNVDGKLFLEEITGGKEVIKNASLISFDVGATRRFTLGNDFASIKVAGVVAYQNEIIAGERYLNGKGYAYPTNENFPKEIQSIDDLKSFYATNIKEDGTGTTALAKLSYGILLSPSYQKKLNYKYGIDFGLDYYIGLSNLIAKSSSSTPIFPVENRKESIIADYAEKSTLNQLRAKIGLLIIFE